MNMQNRKARLSDKKTLSRCDKFPLVQFVLQERTEEESSLLLKNGGEYPIWSPYHAHEAAETLLNELDRHSVAPFEE